MFDIFDDEKFEFPIRSGNNERSAIKIWKIESDEFEFCLSFKIERSRSSSALFSFFSLSFSFFLGEKKYSRETEIFFCNFSFLISSSKNINRDINRNKNSR